MFYNLIFNLFGSGSLWIAIICYVCAFLLESYNIDLPFFIDSAMGLSVFYALGNLFAQSKSIKLFFLNKESKVCPLLTAAISGGGYLR